MLSFLNFHSREYPALSMYFNGTHIGKHSNVVSLQLPLTRPKSPKLGHRRSSSDSFSSSQDERRNSARVLCHSLSTISRKESLMISPRSKNFTAAIAIKGSPEVRDRPKQQEQPTKATASHQISDQTNTRVAVQQPTRRNHPHTPLYKKLEIQTSFLIWLAKNDPFKFSQMIDWICFCRGNKSTHPLDCNWTPCTWECVKHPENIRLGRRRRNATAMIFRFSNTTLVDSDDSSRASYIR